MSIDYYQDSKQLFTDPFPKIRNNLRAKMCRKKRRKTASRDTCRKGREKKENLKEGIDKAASTCIVTWSRHANFRRTILQRDSNLDRPSPPHC